MKSISGRINLLGLLIVLIISGILAELSSVHLQKSLKLSINKKELASYLSTYLKASQAFFVENGKLATSTIDLGEYIIITGCKTNDNYICRTSAVEDYSDKEITRWYSVSGKYEIEMKSDNDQNIFVATPTGKLEKEGFGASGCFNSKNGKTKILGMDTKGPNVEIANCAD